MKNRFILPIAIVCFFLLNGFVGAESKRVTEGSRLPDTIFQDHPSKEERAYLGLSQKAKFSFKDVGGALLLIEIFSTYCASCPRNVPVLNTVYSAIEGDPVLKGKVKVIGIAVGNTAAEVEVFKKEYNVSYPIITDLHFTLHKALGNPRVPYTVLVRKSIKGYILAYVHQGELGSPDDVLKNIRGILSNSKQK